MVKKCLVIAFGVMAMSSAHAVVLTQWNFNSPVPDANTGTGTTLPAIGAGSASLIGGVTATFASGDASGGSSDPAVGDDSAWNTTTYPAAQSNSGTAGVRFDVSTVGFNSITVNFDTRHSNTSSRYTRFDYSLDGGTTWNESTIFDADQGGDKWYNNRSVNLTSIAGASNNANFAFRMVSVFGPTAGAYVATTSTATYSTAGTLRYDMVTVNAEPVPEPASIAALGVAAVAILRRRNRRK